MTEADIEVSGFKARSVFRSDKGKTHSYPVKRMKWNARICQRQSKTNLEINQTDTQIENMEPKHKFKSTPAMRIYWAEQKRKQRSKEKRQGSSQFSGEAAGCSFKEVFSQ